MKSSFSVAGSSLVGGVENVKYAAVLSGSKAMNVDKYNKILLDFQDGSDGHYAKVCNYIFHALTASCGEESQSHITDVPVSTVGHILFYHAGKGRVVRYEITHQLSIHPLLCFP